MQKGFTLVELIVIVAIIAIIIGIIIPIVVANNNSSNNTNNDRKDVSEETIAPPAETPEIDKVNSREEAEEKIRLFENNMGKINFSYYRNTVALKKIMDIESEISRETEPVANWTDEVLQYRTSIIDKYFPLLEIRQDKRQLKRSLDKMLRKNIPNDRRYKGDEVNKYKSLIDRANSAISNMDASEENVLTIDKEINDYTNKYKDYPWWAWLIFCLLTIYPQICFLVVVLCVPLWYCTFFAWWHTLLVLIPATVIVDFIIILLHEEFC